MDKPWTHIELVDYENHMQLPSVMQLQAMNDIMYDQFYRYDISSIMILGVAGGNGLNHIKPDVFNRVYGVTNPTYISSIIQVNIDAHFVSDSPYLHKFDGLE